MNSLHLSAQLAECWFSNLHCQIVGLASSSAAAAAAAAAALLHLTETSVTSYIILFCIPQAQRFSDIFVRG
jgi:hypothetical protein